MPENSPQYFIGFIILEAGGAVVATFVSPEWPLWGRIVLIVLCYGTPALILMPR